MLFDEYTLIATRVLKGYEGSGSLQITAIEPSPRGPIVRWEAPRLATERVRRPLPGGGTTIGPVPGPVILGILSETLAARWKDGLPGIPQDWGERLVRKHRRVFGRQVPSTGPGWYWLWQAGAAALLRSGLPRGWKTTDTKEKFGSIRWYYHAEDDCSRVDNVIDAVTELSGSICEDCGRPGNIGRGGWLRCQCNVHRKKK